MSELRDLYQEVILDHAKRPRNFGRPEHFDHEAHGHNPLCGDKIDVFLILGKDDRVEDIRFDGRGCAISMASASLMTELLKITGELSPFFFLGALSRRFAFGVST